MKKKLLFVPIFAMLVLVACKKEEPVKTEIRAQVVKTMAISTGTDVLVQKIAAKVEALHDVRLSFQVSGKIAELPIKKSQIVKKGDLLARLDAKDFELRVEEAQAQHDEKKSAFERSAKLVKKGYVAQSRYDQDKASFEIAESNLGLAKQNLKYTEIRAPFDGQIADVYVDKHQYIDTMTNQAVAKLQDISKFLVVGAMPESLIIDTKNRDFLDALVVFDAKPDKQYESKYVKHQTDADATTQTYKIYFQIDEPAELSLLPGMSSTLTLYSKLKNKEDGSKHKRHIIPLGALFIDEGGVYNVWKIGDDNRVIKTAIKVGKLVDSGAEILDGLSAGDLIVTAGANFIKEGQLVSSLKQ